MAEVEVQEVLRLCAKVGNVSVSVPVEAPQIKTRSYRA